MKKHTPPPKKKNHPHPKSKTNNNKPIPSMHGIFPYIWLRFMVNVGKYTNPMDAMGNTKRTKQKTTNLRASAPESWKNWTFCRCRWNGRTTLKWKAIFLEGPKMKGSESPQQTQKVKMQKHHKVSGINSCQSMLFVFKVVTFHWTNSLSLENRPCPKEKSLPTINEHVNQTDNTKRENDAFDWKKSSRITRNIEQHRRTSESSKSMS